MGLGTLELVRSVLMCCSRYDIPNGTWRSIPYARGPSARSGSGLVAVKHARTGAEYLITLFGERDPSDVTPGAILNDVWAYDIANAEWSEVTISGTTKPEPRGRFAAVAVGGAENEGVVVHGGLDAENRTLGDWWLLEFD